MGNFVGTLDLPIQSNLRVQRNSVRLTERDLDILEFTLEMKFSTLDDVYKQFFKINQSGELSKNNWFARQRLARLCKAGLLSAVRNRGPSTYYLITSEGYYQLKIFSPRKSFCKPLYDLDVRTFEHDHMMTKLRIKLESERQNLNWQSERSISENDIINAYLPKDLIPDAIYTLEDGKKVALEFERTRKTKQRYDEKISRYIQIMQAPSGNSKLFDLVHYVCEMSSVATLIANKTALFQELFKIDLAKNVLPEVYCG